MTMPPSIHLQREILGPKEQVFDNAPSMPPQLRVFTYEE